MGAGAACPPVRPPTHACTAWHADTHPCTPPPCAGSATNLGEYHHHKPSHHTSTFSGGWVGGWRGVGCANGRGARLGGVALVPRLRCKRGRMPASQRARPPACQPASMPACVPACRRELAEVQRGSKPHLGDSWWVGWWVGGRWVGGCCACVRGVGASAEGGGRGRRARAPRGAQAWGARHFQRLPSPFPLAAPRPPKSIAPRLPRTCTRLLSARCLQRGGSGSCACGGWCERHVCAGAHAPARGGAHWAPRASPAACLPLRLISPHEGLLHPMHAQPAARGKGQRGGPQK